MYIDYSVYNVDDVEPEWVVEFKRCRPWLEAALEYADGTFNIIDVADGIAMGNMHIWPTEDAVAVTQIVNYPRKKVIHAFLVGGKLEGIMKLEKTVVRWAKSQKCHSLTLTGRSGWSKSLLTEIGYKSTSISMSKEI